MRIATHIDRLERQVHLQLSGDATYGDLQAVVSDLLAEDALHFKILSDMRLVAPHFTGAELSMLALRLRTIRSSSGVGNIAVVIGDRHMFELMRMQQSLLGGLCRFQPFWKTEAAERWLDWKPSETVDSPLAAVSPPA